MAGFRRRLAIYLLFVGLLPLVRSQGGGNCMTDSECNFPTGGACNGPTNSCVCFNGYTGAFCAIAPSTGSSPSTASSNTKNAILLISLASLFFWFLSKERSRQEEDWIYYFTLYHPYLYH